MSEPKLRFKEFEGPWEITILGEILKERSEIANDDIPTYSLTIENGVIPKTDRYEREHLVSDKDSAYKLVMQNDFAFNPMNLRFGAIGKHSEKHPVKVSKYYNIFYCSPSANHSFFEAYFRTKKMISFYDKMSTGSLAEKKRVHFSDFLKFEIPVPTNQEQTKIANFLTAVDEKITQLTQKTDLLAQYKKGVMQKIFSQELRFKDDDGQEFPEWEEREVGEIFRVTRGNVLAMPLVSDIPTDTHKYPVYSSQTKNNGLSGYYDEYLFENCITWTTDGANAGDVNFRSGKFYCTNVCGVLVNDKGYANACIAAMIDAVSRKYVSYVGNPKLMNGVMAKITIEFPCVQEQIKIANFLTVIDDKITTTQAQLDAVKQYKQGLLQQMFV